MVLCFSIRYKKCSDSSYSSQYLHYPVFPNWNVDMYVDEKIYFQSRISILMIGFTFAYGSMFAKVWIVHRIGASENQQIASRQKDEVRCLPLTHRILSFSLSIFIPCSPIFSLFSAALKWLWTNLEINNHSAQPSELTSVISRLGFDFASPIGESQLSFGFHPWI